MSGDRYTDLSPELCAKHIRATGIVAIVRGDFTPRALPAIAEALLAGGIDVIEVTLNTTDALAGVEHLRREMDGRMLVGAGTVRTAEDVARAHSAGAQFIVSPNLDLDAVRRSRELGLLHVPGIFTASEAQTAFKAGCKMVKLFPADVLGPAYLRALRAPLDDVAFVPTGGINVDNLADYLRAGAVAVGAGSALVTGPEQDAEELTARAERFVSILRQVRTADD